MANGILKQLNQSLELTLREGLKGLEDFTLQIAYAAAAKQFEILPASPTAGTPSSPKPAALKLVEPAGANDAQQATPYSQRRA